MVADRTYARGLGAFMDMAAVTALPIDLAVFLKDFVLLDVFEQVQIPLLVMLLDLANRLKKERDLIESLFF